MTETLYYIVQINTGNQERLGVNIDVTGSIYKVEEDRAKRFTNLENARQIKTNLEEIGKLLERNDEYEIVKETREIINDESTTV